MKPDGVRVTVIIEGLRENERGEFERIGEPARKVIGFLYGDETDRKEVEKRVCLNAGKRSIEAYRDLVFGNRWLAEDDPMNALYVKDPV